MMSLTLSMAAELGIHRAPYQLLSYAGIEDLECLFLEYQLLHASPALHLDTYR